MMSLGWSSRISSLVLTGHQAVGCRIRPGLLAPVELARQRKREKTMASGTCRLFDPQPVTLTGNLVRLEPIGLEHAVDLYAAGAEESIWTYLPRRAFISVSDAGRWIRDCVKQLDTAKRVHFAVMHRETAKAVGSTGYLDIERAHKTLEIGMTWYGLAWQRTGVNTECKYLLLRHAFEDMGARRVSFKWDDIFAEQLATDIIVEQRQRAPQS